MAPAVDASRFAWMGASRPDKPFSWSRWRCILYPRCAALRLPTTILDDELSAQMGCLVPRLLRGCVTLASRALALAWDFATICPDSFLNGSLALLDCIGSSTHSRVCCCLSWLTWLTAYVALMALFNFSLKDGMEKPSESFRRFRS